MEFPPVPDPVGSPDERQTGIQRQGKREGMNLGEGICKNKNLKGIIALY